MSERLPGWRNAPVQAKCKHCKSEFTGKYNSSVCPGCVKHVRTTIYTKFREDNPHYWKQWAKTAAGKACQKRQRLKMYGMTEHEYEALLKAQHSKCAICGEVGGWRSNGGKLVIDHCHRKNKHRGLLCPYCNRGLGQFWDNPRLLREAANYIERTAQHD